MVLDKVLIDKNFKGCYVIAEAGLNHNGSVKIAKKLIDLASEAGADAVKFQKRTVDILAVKSVLDAPDDRFPEFGKTYRQIREYLEFDFEQYKELKSYSELKGLDFIVTAFDIDAVDFLEKLNIDVYKLASHSLTNIQLLEYLAKIKKKVILSTGMAEIDEITTAVNIFKRYDTPLILLHCVSSYPTPINECNLKMMDVLYERFDVPVGYSGHELGYLPSLTAVAMGAKVIERHYTLENSLTGFDHKMSLGPEDFIEMVKKIREIEQIKGNGEKFVSESEMITRNKYHVSITSAQKIKSGTILDQTMICYRNPGTGIPAKESNNIIGKTTVTDIPEDVLLTYEMFK